MGNTLFGSDLCMQNCIQIQEHYSANQILWTFSIIYENGILGVSLTKEILLQICAKLTNWEM